MSNLHPRGVFSAALTPLDADLLPDHPRFVAHCHRLLAEGCDGIAMLGTTGEANSFSSDERRALLEAAIAGGVLPKQLLPGTGVTALMETVALTRHALASGVTTVVMLPPYYYKGISEDGLFASYAEVVERVGDGRLRVILYHIPQMSAVPIPFTVIARLRERYPGIFTGIKDSAGDLAHMTALVRAFPGLSVLAGADPLMLPLLREGGAGCITATSNIVATELAFVFRHFADPDRAAEVEAAQARIVAARNRASRFAQMPSLKVMLSTKLQDECWRRMRPPLLPLTAEEAAGLLND